MLTTNSYSSCHPYCRVYGFNTIGEFAKPSHFIHGAHNYGVIFRKTKLEGSELEYTLDHSSYFYFLKPDGTLITKVPHTLTPAPIVEAINKLTQ
jgi:cytochrome oxidase Cu insertion factor (SCO1/SenC/PrrC family)